MFKFNQTVYDRSPVFIQNLMCSLAGWNLNKIRFGKAFNDWSAFFADSATWDLNALREYQSKQVLQIVANCFKRVPFYAQKWREAGIEPGSIRSLDDFARLPAVTKEDLRTCHENMFDKCIPRKKLYVTTTGGSTGIPLIRYSTREELQRHYAAVWAKLRPGVRRGDRYATFGAQAVVPSRKKKPPFWRENTASNQRLYSMRHLRPEFLGEYAKSLIETPFVFYQGLKSMMFIVAQYMLERHLSLPVPPKAVFTTSEQLLPAEREIIETAWNTKIRDEYCQGEMCAIIHECQFGNRHLAMDYSYVELEPAGHDGSNDICELVCTSFVCQAAPLIRYRIGDKVLLHENQNCPCGQAGPVIKAIFGRVSDYLVTADGRRIPHVAGMMGQFRNIRSSQFYQETTGSVVVRVIPSVEFCQKDEEAIRQIVLSYVGRNLEVSVSAVPELERLPNGKVPNVISRIPVGQSGMQSAD